MTPYCILQVPFLYKLHFYQILVCRVYPMMLPFSVLYFDWSRHVVVLLVYVDFMIHNDFLYTVSSFSVNSTLSGILGQAVEGMYTYTYNLQFRIQIWGLYLRTLSSQTPIYGICCKYWKILNIHIRKWFWIKSACEETPQLVLPLLASLWSDALGVTAV